MTTWAIIPVKGTEEAKTRLAEVLVPSQRLALSRAMLRHVLSAVRAARGIDRIHLLAPSVWTPVARDLPEGIERIDEPGGGLNAALAHGLAVAATAGASRVVIVASDLPCLRPDQVEALAATAPGTIALAPDRHGAGTNALSLPLPAARDFRFAYGPDSLAAHYRECARLALEPRVVDMPGLALDIDVAADLPDARGVWDGLGPALKQSGGT